MSKYQEWDSNPRLQGRLRRERSALDRVTILMTDVGAADLASWGAQDRGCLGAQAAGVESVHCVDVEMLLGAKVSPRPDPGPGRGLAPCTTADHEGPPRNGTCVTLAMGGTRGLVHGGHTGPWVGVLVGGAVWPHR